MTKHTKTIDTLAVEFATCSRIPDEPWLLIFALQGVCEAAYLHDASPGDKDDARLACNLSLAAKLLADELAKRVMP
jgi:hypothetical protein